MEIRRTQTQTGDFSDHLALFNLCFPHARHYTAAYLSWLYNENPAGPVVGFDAVASGRLVGHYACIPAPIVRNGRSAKALLSLNTATHPEFQGRGLFSRLAEDCYGEAAKEGFEIVFGVANQNSIRGFSGRLRFQDVVGLEARVGVGPRSREEIGRGEGASEFYRAWTPESLLWRVRNPANPLAMRRSGSDRCVVSGRTGYPLIRVLCEVPSRLAPHAATGQLLRALPNINLTIGLRPRDAGARHGLSVVLPDRLKPSPLRLIYRNLVTPEDRLSPDAVYFNFIDFDAY